MRSIKKTVKETQPLMQYNNLINDAIREFGSQNITIITDDAPAYRVRSKIYPLTGLIEHTVYETPMLLPNKPKTKKRVKPLGSVSVDPNYNKRNNRAKQSVYDYVLGNRFDYWTTLTFNEEKHPWCFDYEEVTKVVPKWFANFKRRHCPSLFYLMVFEVRQSGAWHVHLFLGGVGSQYVIATKHKNKYNRTWHDFVPWSKQFGFTSLDPIGTLYDTDHTSLFKIASYLSKYMTKTRSSEANKKRFRVSHGLTPKPRDSYRFESQPLETLKTDTTKQYHGYHYVRNDEGAIYNVAHKFTERSMK